MGQNDRSACSRGLRRAAGAYPAARSLPGWAFFLFCTWRASAAVAEEYCGLMYLAICVGTPVALLQVGPFTFCCLVLIIPKVNYWHAALTRSSYLAAYIVAFLGSLGRQSAAFGSWILREGTSSVSQRARGSGTTTTRRWHLHCSAERPLASEIFISSAGSGGGASCFLPAPLLDQLFAQMKYLDSGAHW